MTATASVSLRISGQCKLRDPSDLLNAKRIPMEGDGQKRGRTEEPKSDKIMILYYDSDTW